LEKKKILFHGHDLIDFASMEERKGDNVRPIRRRVVWNMEKEDTLVVSSIKTDIPNLSPTTNPDEEPQDLLEFMLTLSTQRDTLEKENKNLKSQIDEMVGSLKEVIETRDRALLNQKETLQALNRVTEEATLAVSQVKSLSGKLQVKESENRELNLMNSELRIKLSSELQELGKTLEPKVEETEKLKNELKILQNDLVGKEKEIEVLRSNTNTPVTSPRLSGKFHSARVKSPVRQENNQMSSQSSNSYLPKLKLSPTTSSAPSEINKSGSTRTSGHYSARHSRDGTETPKQRQQPISPRSSDIGTKILSVLDPTFEGKKINANYRRIKRKIDPI